MNRVPTVTLQSLKVRLWLASSSILNLVNSDDGMEREYFWNICIIHIYAINYGSFKKFKKLFLIISIFLKKNCHLTEIHRLQGRPASGQIIHFFEIHQYFINSLIQFNLVPNWIWFAFEKPSRSLLYLAVDLAATVAVWVWNSWLSS